MKRVSIPIIEESIKIAAHTFSSLSERKICLTLHKFINKEKQTSKETDNRIKETELKTDNDQLKSRKFQDSGR